MTPGPMITPNPRNSDRMGFGVWGWEEPHTPDHSDNPLKQQPSQPIAIDPVFIKVQEKVILLSFFKGIGSAALLAAELTDGISLHLSWEDDADCLAVLNHYFLDSQHRGDFLKDNPEQVAEAMKSHDPTGEMIILFVAAPHCPDFSQIRDDAPGSSGPEGPSARQVHGTAPLPPGLSPSSRING